MRRLFAAGVAALAVAGLVGGGTFAQWSDYGTVDGNKIGAGVLKIDLAGVGEGSLNFNNVRLAPDVNGDFSPTSVVYWIGSANGANVPTGALSLTFKNYQSTEGNDGVATPYDIANNCTTRSEEDAEGGTCTMEGEFDAEAYFGAMYTDPMPTPAGPDYATACFAKGFTHTGLASGPGRPDGLMKTAVPGKTINLGTVSAGQGVCLQLQSYLPGTTDNKVQGDYVTFDTQFDLVQNNL